MFSCDNPKVEYFENGNISKEYRLKNNQLDGIYKEFYPDGKTQLIHIYDNGIKIDSSCFFKNGKIEKVDYYKNNDTLFSVRFYPNLKKKEEGYFYNKNKIGKWLYYNYNGKLEKGFEYIILNGQQYTNQGWYIDNNNDTILAKSNFYRVSVEKKNLKLLEPTKIKIFYKPLSKNAVSGFLLSKEKSMKDDYSNLDEHKLDTIYFVDNKLEFSIGFKDEGNKNIGGYILEVNTDTTPKGVYSERKVYLSIPLEVH